MIRVTIELISAVTGRTSELGRMYITNDGKRSAQDPKLGDYQVAVCRKGTTEIPTPCSVVGPKPTRAGEVRDYPRLAYNVWRLITRACLAAFPEERPKGKPNGVRPVIDERVMRGLQLLRHFAPREIGAFPSSVCPAEHADMAAARAWLDVAESGCASLADEPDEKASGYGIGSDGEYTTNGKRW